MSENAPNELSAMIARITAIVESSRCPLHDEKATQSELAGLFCNAGLMAKRESRLSASDIPDFMIGPVAVEIKIKGQRSAIVRQLERYALYDAVQSIVLITGRSVNLPASMCGKPVAQASLSRGWL